MMLAQISPEQVTLTAGCAAALYFLKCGFDLYSQWHETRERRRMRKELIRQTEVLREIHEQQRNTCRFK